LATPLERALTSAAAAFALALAAPAQAEAPACDLAIAADPGPEGAAGEQPVQVWLSTAARPRFEPSAGRVTRIAQWASGEWRAQWLLAPEKGRPPALLAVFAGDRCGWVPFLPPASAERPVGRAADRGRAHAGEPLLHLVLLRDAIEPWNFQVTTFAATADGAPWPGAPPTLTATAGTLGDLEPAGPGAWRASWAVGAREAGEARIAAALDKAFVRRAVADLPGPPARLEVQTDRGQVQAGDEAPVELTVKVLDGAGRPAASDPPILEDALGSAGEVEELERGTWRASLRVPVAFEGHTRLKVSARLGQLLGTAELELAGGPPAAIDAVAQLSPRRGPGALVGEVVAVAFDAFGNPVPARGLQARAARGTLGPPVDRERGRLAFPYRQEVSADDPGEDVVTLELGELTRELPVRASLLPPRLSVAARAGVAPRTGTPGPHAGIGVLGWADWGGEHLALGLDLGGWTFGQSGRAPVGSAAVAWRTGTRLAAVTLSLTWRSRPWRRVLLAATAGGGAGWLERRSELAGQRALTEGRWAGLATAALAAGWRAWRGGPFLEVRATWLPRTGLESLRGSFTTLSFALGYWLDAG